MALSIFSILRSLHRDLHDLFVRSRKKLEETWKWSCCAHLHVENYWLPRLPNETYSRRAATSRIHPVTMATSVKTMRNLISTWTLNCRNCIVLCFTFSLSFDLSRVADERKSICSAFSMQWFIASNFKCYVCFLANCFGANVLTFELRQFFCFFSFLR